MSQLISNLKVAARIEPPPMGFASVSAPSSKVKPVLVARIGSDAKQVSTLLKGADAVFIDVHQEEIADKLIKQLAREKSKNKVPHGCWLGNNSACRLDFSVLAMDTDMALLKNEKSGKVLIIHPEVEDKYLRLLDDLPVDAILVARNEDQPCRLTLQNYMLCQRMAMVISKPLIVHVSAKIGAQEISDMWDYGIDGVMVDADNVEPLVISNFKKMIDKLELGKKRKKIRLTPIIPGIAAAQPKPEPEPSPDEDDDEEWEDGYHQNL